ncbi:MAG: FliM/FliN family flagellar motor switch protein [Myxococcota bacterium]
MDGAIRVSFADLPKIGKEDAQLLTRWARCLPVGVPTRLFDACRRLFHQIPTIEAGPPDHLRGAAWVSPLVLGVLEHPTGQRVAVEVDPSLARLAIQRILGLDDVRAFEARALTEPERGVLLYALARLLRGYGSDYRVRSVVTDPVDAPAALEGLRVQWPVRVWLGAEQGFLRFYFADAPNEHRRRWAPHLRSFEVIHSVEAGRGSLPMDEVRRLRVGDVVIPDRSYFFPGAEATEVRIRAAGAGRTEWRCAVHKGELRVAEEIQRGGHSGVRPRRVIAAPAHERKEHSMNDNKQAEGLHKVGDAPIELSVELLRLALTLEEVANLRPGEIILTQRDLGAKVTLRAQDRAIAEGELVQVDGELGIRLTSLA